MAPASSKTAKNSARLKHILLAKKLSIFVSSSLVSEGAAFGLGGMDGCVTGISYLL